MMTFWVLGRRFADDHDRAIRFVDPPIHSESRRKRLGLPNDKSINQTWCDKCSAWHATRMSKLPSDILTNLSKVKTSA